LAEHDPTARRLAAILSADAVGYSRLMAEDEAGTIQTLNAYREAIGSLVEQHRGRIVDSPGDNLLAEFPNALDAVQCAVEIQGVLRVRNQSLAENRRMSFRIGLHLGDITAKGDRIYGDGVNITARLEGLAEPGGICISATVHDQVRKRLDSEFEDLGQQQIKNITEPVHVYRIRLETQPLLPTRKSQSTEQGRLSQGAAASLGAPEKSQRTSVVVLPFDNLSPDPGDAYFSDGLTEEIITNLAYLRSLRVISRSTAMVLKDTQKDVRTIGRDLDVEYVLEGSVRKAGDSLRITAQLIDARSDEHVWAERHEGTIGDIFEVQERIAKRIVHALKLKLSPAEESRLVDRPIADPKAYDIWILAMHEGRKFSQEGTQRGIQLAERALEMMGDNARVYASLGYLYYTAYDVAVWHQDEALDRAERYASQALELDPTLPLALFAKGLVRYKRGDIPGFVRHARPAAKLGGDSDAQGILAARTKPWQWTPSSSFRGAPGLPWTSLEETPGLPWSGFGLRAIGWRPGNRSPGGGWPRWRPMPARSATRMRNTARWPRWTPASGRTIANSFGEPSRRTAMASCSSWTPPPSLTWQRQTSTTRCSSQTP
jgi:adenylate cyclase